MYWLVENGSRNGCWWSWKASTKFDENGTTLGHDSFYRCYPKCNRITALIDLQNKVWILRISRKLFLASKFQNGYRKNPRNISTTWPCVPTKGPQGSVYRFETHYGGFRLYSKFSWKWNYSGNNWQKNRTGDLSSTDAVSVPHKRHVSFPYFFFLQI